MEAFKRLELRFVDKAKCRVVHDLNRPDQSDEGEGAAGIHKKNDDERIHGAPGPIRGRG